MITELQRLTRKQFIGSSDAAAILGLDPFKSAADVFLDKTGQAADFEGNDATDRGTLLEPVILSWAEQQLEVVLERNVELVHPNNLLAANLDSRFSARGWLVEAKSSVNAEEWGEPGTDQIPQRVIVQTHHQFVVAGPEYRVAWVPVLLPGFKSFDFRMYRIDRNDELAAMVEKSGVDFMQNFVLPNVRPHDYRPSIDVLKRVRRQPNKVIEISPKIALEWQFAREERLAAQESEEKATADLLAEMGDAEGATFPGGAITYLETTRKSYVVKESTYRTLRLKAAKGS